MQTNEYWFSRFIKIGNHFIPQVDTDMNKVAWLLLASCFTLLNWRKKVNFSDCFNSSMLSILKIIWTCNIKCVCSIYRCSLHAFIILVSGFFVCLSCIINQCMLSVIYTVSITSRYGTYCFPRTVHIPTKLCLYHWLTKYNSWISRLFSCNLSGTKHNTHYRSIRHIYKSDNV